MTRAEIQEAILTETGIKTSVKKLSGSMKKHVRFSPMLQNGQYQKYPVEWRREFVKKFKSTHADSNYGSDYEIDILLINIEEGEPIKYQKERKQKTIEQMSQKTWGSKNSQLRLDKATARNAKKLRAGTTARYY